MLEKVINRYQESPSKTTLAIVDLLETVIIAVAVSGFIYLTLALPNQVDGLSMEPNFSHNDLLLTNKTIQWMGPTSLGEKLDYDYKKGDVIIFKEEDNDLIKRIIATPGDTIRFDNNEIYINGEELDEKYIPKTYRTKTAPVGLASIQEGEEITVPDDHYFVMGDNRENSKDSRFTDVGFVPREDVRGKVFLRYWPLTSFGIIGRGEPTDTNDR